MRCTVFHSPDQYLHPGGLFGKTYYNYSSSQGFNQWVHVFGLEEYPIVTFQLESF
jgi:hypothetical protein